MQTRYALAIAVWLGVTTPVAGQGRGPEQEPLAAMIGRWQTELEIKAPGATLAEKVADTEECAWFANLHVVCRNDAKTEAGSYSAIRLLSYYAPTKQYAVYTVDSTGSVLLAFGQIAGDTWTFTAEAGESKSRLVIKMGPASYTGTSELSIRNGAWTPVSQVKATRVEP